MTYALDQAHDGRGQLARAQVAGQPPGVVRRQLRVINGSCERHPALEAVFQGFVRGRVARYLLALQHHPPGHFIQYRPDGFAVWACFFPAFAARPKATRNAAPSCVRTRPGENRVCGSG